VWFVTVTVTCVGAEAVSVTVEGDWVTVTVVVLGGSVVVAAVVVGSTASVVVASPVVTLSGAVVVRRGAEIVGVVRVGVVRVPTADPLPPPHEVKPTADVTPSAPAIRSRDADQRAARPEGAVIGATMHPAPDDVHRALRDGGVSSRIVIERTEQEFGPMFTQWPEFVPWPTEQMPTGTRRSLRVVRRIRVRVRGRVVWAGDPRRARG